MQGARTVVKKDDCICFATLDKAITVELCQKSMYWSTRKCKLCVALPQIPAGFKLFSAPLHCTLVLCSPKPKAAGRQSFVIYPMMVMRTLCANLDRLPRWFCLVLFGQHLAPGKRPFARCQPNLLGNPTPKVTSFE